MILLVLIYADDMAIASNSIVQVETFKKNIAKSFEITDLGELKWVLGIQVGHDRKGHIITMCQTTYIHHILKQFGMYNCVSVSTPLTIKHDLSVSQSPETEEAHTKYFKYAKGLHYLELVGLLLYITQTQPDI